MQRILVIDDDKDICLILTRFLNKNNYNVLIAHSGKEGLTLVGTEDFDLILCDYKLPDITGINLLKKVKELNPSIPFIIITGYSDVRTAVETFRYGASDYIIKPLHPDELLVTVREAIAKGASRQTDLNEIHSDHPKIKEDQKNKRSPVTDFIIGPSSQSKTVQRYVELIAPSDMSVVITGETGTGKEFIAQSIHRLSSRSKQPLVAIDCGALPVDLAGSELFGHIKGSFTGAISDKKGSFEAANKGTIFLDEVGNLSYENQTKLLRVLQERRIKRIGATEDIAIDVRVISATNENLLKCVKEGRFREDLFHRLNEFQIQLEPLRERKEDIIFFAEFFLKKANETLKKNVRGFSEEVRKYMMNYYWHGNLRELNNFVKRSTLLTPSDLIECDVLPEEIINSDNPDPSPINGPSGLRSVAWSSERQAIIDVLEQVKYNKSKASELLQIDRKTLYNKLKLYNIPA